MCIRDREGTPEDLLKAMRLYQAVKIICEKKKLDAVTLSCFSLIEKLGTTGCLALALLNDEGIPAGCEGDLQSIFTLLIAKTLTGQAGFMANPAFINDCLLYTSVRWLPGKCRKNRCPPPR